MVKTDIEEASVSNGMGSSVLLNASPWSVHLCAKSLRDSVQPFSGWHNINKGGQHMTHMNKKHTFISTQRNSQPVLKQNKTKILDMYPGINVPISPEKTKQKQTNKQQQQQKLLAPLQF